jgi:hypothetical protein
MAASAATSKDMIPVGRMSRDGQKSIYNEVCENSIFYEDGFENGVS